MPLKVFFINFFFFTTHCFSFHASNNVGTECTDENFKKFDIKPLEVVGCKDVTVKLTNLGGNKFWLIINHFYNIHYYDFEFNYDQDAIESIVSKKFDVRQLVKNKKKIRFLTNNNCEDYSKFKHLHSIHDYETKTSLLLSKEYFTVNGIIFNKYQIRNIDHRKHIVVEFKNTVNTYEEIYYNNLLEPKILNETKSNGFINLNINVDYSKTNKFLKTEVRVMNILMYWNAVAMLFSGLRNTLIVKIKKINFAETPGVIFPVDVYSMLSIHSSMNNYFIENRVSSKENIDTQVAMTTSDICLRFISHNCDIQGYTLLLSDKRRNDKYRIAVISYSPSLLNYNFGARETAHLLGVNYDVSCDGIMSKKKSKKTFTWCAENLRDFEDVRNFINILKRNSKNNRNSHIPLTID